MNFNVAAPINSVSFGFVSYNILKEFYEAGLSPSIFPIGQVDLSSFDKVTQDFQLWLQSCVNKALAKYDRNNPGFRLWHIGGSETSHSNKQSLLTFYECDQPTPVERNILANQATVFVSSKFTQRVFENSGLNNIQYLPLGFDRENFRKIEAPHPYGKQCIVFGIMGKWEPGRKHTDKLIKTWIRKYKNNPRYKLHIHTYNNFLHPDPNQCKQLNANLISQCFEGQNIWNVSVVNDHLKTLTEYNSFINSVDIMLDGSGNEGFSLPHFHACALGKHLVAVNSNGVADWANKENSVLVNPVGKKPSADGMFFHAGSSFNQGNFFTWAEEDYIAAMEEAETRYLSNPLNIKGIELQNQFTWKNTANKIIENIK